MYLYYFLVLQKVIMNNESAFDACNTICINTIKNYKMFKHLAINNLPPSLQLIPYYFVLIIYF